MSTVLFINAHPQSDATKSVSVSIGEVFKQAYQSARPDDKIVELDLYRVDVPLIDEDLLNGWAKYQAGETPSAVEMEKIGRHSAFTEQFLQADKYVIINPVWNFSVPPLLKAYIDTFVVAGKAFAFTSQGPQGLLTDKKVVHIQSSGSVFSEGPYKGYDFSANYLDAVLAFTGVPYVERIYVEGTAVSEIGNEKAKAKALERIPQVIETFAQ